MRFLLDLLYLVTLVALSPWLLFKARTTGKYRRGLRAKITGRVAAGDLLAGQRPTIWFHGVSVGEIHLLRQVVAAFRRHHPDWQCVISSTTDTGFEEAGKHFADLPVIWWPLDFSWAVRRALQQVRPDLLVLAENELWPNFLRAAKQQGVPVAVINARMSPRSCQRYRRLGPLARGLLGPVDLFCAQTEEHAANLLHLGVRRDRILVTGSVKYDGVTGQRDNSRTRQLRELFGIGQDELVLVAGSTQAPEEEIVLEMLPRLRKTCPGLRVILVPRQRERFEEVAALLRRAGEPFLRRTDLREGVIGERTRAGVILVDTMGELAAVWGLADVAFVGGSLDGKRGGQNMIEPAAYGAAVLFGPHVWNFRDTANRLLEAGAALQVSEGQALEATVRDLLADEATRRRMGEAARQLVHRQQGATARTVAALDEVLHAGRTVRAA